MSEEKLQKDLQRFADEKKEHYAKMAKKYPQFKQDIGLTGPEFQGPYGLSNYHVRCTIEEIRRILWDNGIKLTIDTGVGSPKEYRNE